MATIKKVMTATLFSFWLVGLIGCMKEDIWNGENTNPVYVACGKSCKTLTFENGNTELTDDQQQTIRFFVDHMTKRQPVIVSPCVSNDVDVASAQKQMERVVNVIKKLGYSPVIVKMTLPAEPQPGYCINLLRGELRVVPPECPNTSVHPTVGTLSSNFGCATNHNFALMVDNPWDLLAVKGDRGTESTRMAGHIDDLRTGKNAALATDSSTTSGGASSGG